ARSAPPGRGLQPRTGRPMELTSLHLLDLDVVRAFVDAANGTGDLSSLPLDSGWRRLLVEGATSGRLKAAAGDEIGANALTYGLGQALTAVQPSYFHPGLSLTAWEARIDRGV